MSKSTRTLNVREQLEAAANWLAFHDEDMAYGLKSPQDGLRLWLYAEAHPELDEMADTWKPADRRKALGYDPLDGVQRSAMGDV